MSDITKCDNDCGMEKTPRLALIWESWYSLAFVVPFNGEIKKDFCSIACLHEWSEKLLTEQVSSE